MENMAKSSGGTRSTNARSAYSGLGPRTSENVSNINGIKLDSAEAYDVKERALESLLKKIPAGTQVDFTHPKSGNTNSFVKNNSGNFVQKLEADKGELQKAIGTWTPGSLTRDYIEKKLNVKKYKS